MRKGVFKSFLVISLLIALVDVVFVYMNYRLSESAFHAHLEKEAETLNLNFETLLAQTYSNMQSIATYIANDEQVQALFLAGKKAVEREGGGPGGEQAALIRRQLYDQVAPNWSQVQKNFSTRQLHFHLGPGSTSFLRVHKPSKFGDNMDNVRFTIVDTNKEQTPRVGFETGRVYSGLRGVVPVRAFDREVGEYVHVGALEVGTSFQVLLDIIDETSNFGSGVLLTKEHIDSAMWPEFIETRFKNRSLVCGCVVEAKSREGFEGLIEAAQAEGVLLRTPGVKILNINGRPKLTSSQPLRDYLGQVDSAREAVGAIVYWKDISVEVANLRAAQHYNILYGIAGFLIVELLVFLALRFGTRRLRQVIDKDTRKLRTLGDRLNAAQSIAHLGNWEWDIASGDIWWSDEIYHIFGLCPDGFKPTYEAFLNRVHPDDRSLVECNVEQALENDKPYVVEHRIVSPEGEEKVVAERALVVRDQDGKPIKMSGTVHEITSLKQAEQAAKASEKLYRQMFELNTAIKLLIDPESGQIIRANKSACEFYGYSEEELLERSIFDINSLSEAEIKQEMESALTEKRRFYRFKHRLANGEVRDVDIHTGPVDVGGHCYLYSVVFDVTDRNRYEQSLLETTSELEAEREKLKRAANVFSHAQEGIIITDAEGIIIETNQAFTDITGFSEAEVIGKNPRIFQSGRQTKEFYQSMWKELNDKGCWQGEIWNRSKLGNLFAESLTVTAVKDDDGKVTNYVAIFSDITVQKQKEESLHRNANFDRLTSLPNRWMLQSTLEGKLLSRRRSNMAVLYVDLDGFKPINDAHGHGAGDELLIEISKRFTSHIRNTDMAARVGGDEFVVMIDEVATLSEAENFASRILGAISVPVSSDYGELAVSASIGVVFIDKASKIEYGRVIKLADSNMYQAKNSGKNQIFVTMV